MDLILALIITVFFLLIAYFIGSMIERKHFAEIKEREIKFLKYPCINFDIKKWDSNTKIEYAKLVTGEVVVSGDYFKNFVAGLKNFFGGELSTLESIMDRARREAILRMRENAIGSNMIINVKIESISLTDLNDSSAIPQVAIIAYGTAMKYATK